MRLSRWFLVLGLVAALFSLGNYLGQHFRSSQLETYQRPNLVPETTPQEEVAKIARRLQRDVENLEVLGCREPHLYLWQNTDGVRWLTWDRDGDPDKGIILGDIDKLLTEFHAAFEARNKKDK